MFWVKFLTELRSAGPWVQLSEWYKDSVSSILLKSWDRYLMPKILLSTQKVFISFKTTSGCNEAWWLSEADVANKNHVWKMMDPRYGRGDKKVRVHYTYNPPTIKPLINGPAPLWITADSRFLQCMLPAKAPRMAITNHCLCLSPKSYAWSQPKSWRIVVVTPLVTLLTLETLTGTDLQRLHSFVL